MEKGDKMREVELLAPAGDLEKLKIAFEYGADAVYIGGEIFGMRSAAKNFTKENMIEGVNFAHERGKKVFVTCNIIPRSEDLEILRDYLLELEEIGVDAVIVSDPGVFKVVKETIPNMEVHISTQASTTNYNAANFWYNKGAQRIVTARELSFEETKEIREHIPEDMDIEAFVHGAMCMSYSGKCTISNYTTGRDANKGSCAQSCRWKYTLMEENNGEYTQVIDDIDPDFFFNTKDLCMIEYIPQIFESGITSLKIEGRMKTAYYIATVVKSYRMLIDEYQQKGFISQQCLDNSKSLIARAANRATFEGFYPGKVDISGQIYENAQTANQSYIANVVDCKDHIALIEVRNYFKKGDRIRLFNPKGQDVYFTLDKLFDTDGNEVEIANKPMQKLYMHLPIDVNQFTFITKSEER